MLDMAIFEELAMARTGFLANQSPLRPPIANLGSRVVKRARSFWLEKSALMRTNGKEHHVGDTPMTRQK